MTPAYSIWLINGKRWACVGDNCRVQHGIMIHYRLSKQEAQRICDRYLGSSLYDELVVVEMDVDGNPPKCLMR